MIINFCISIIVQVCEFGGDDCVKTPSLVDRMAHKYSDRLVQRVEAMYNQLKVPCNLLDLPPVPTRPATTHKKMIHIKAALAQQQGASDTDAAAGEAALADVVAIKPVNGHNSVYDSNKNQIKVI